MWALAGGVFLGWALGANDAANVFGTAVAARVIRFTTAALVASMAIVAGAYFEGAAGIETLAAVSTDSLEAAVLATICAAIAVTAMTLAKLPVSTSQAVVGAIIGTGLVAGQADWSGLPKILTCWVATPIAALLISCCVYALLRMLLNRVGMSILTRDNLLWMALIVAGAYGAYALGANNVANVTGVFYGTGPFDSTSQLALIGGISMALGALTFGRRVMMTVGADLVRLDAFAALVAVLSEAITVHMFAEIGVPVSTSQALVGGVLGVGIMRGVRGIDRTVLGRIALGWVLTPFCSGALSAAATLLLAK